MTCIWVDQHEDTSVIEYIRKLGTEVIVRSQPTDYIIQGVSGSVAIERKEVSDFYGSLTSGRLWEQMEVLKIFQDEGYIPILLIEGNFWKIQKWRRIPLTTVLGAINSVVLDWGIHVVRMENKHMTANWLHSIAQRMGRPAEDRVHSIRHKIHIDHPDMRARYLVEGLPGVSGTLAIRLLQHFGTPRQVFSASTEELLQVRGLGERKVQEIVRVLDHRYEG